MGEVEVARSPQEEVFGIGDDADEILEAEDEAVEVVRAETPPAHARIVLDVPDENPWA